MSSHSHKKTNNSDRARREHLKRDSKKQGKAIHGEGMKQNKPKKK